MKRILLTAAITAAVLTVAIGIYGGSLIRSAQTNTVNAVQSIAGALSNEYPDAVPLIAGAAGGEYSEVGAEIMARYGYRQDQELYGSYSSAMSGYFILIAALAAVPLCGSAAMYILSAEQTKKRDKRIIYYLEHCLDSSANADELSGDRLSAPLTAVAERLRLSAERRSAERENIKSLVSDISHQLKTPVSALRVCLDMCGESQTENERSEFISRAQTQADKLEKLCAALVSISRLEAGMIELKPEQTDAGDIIISAVNAIYPKAAEKSIEISFDASENAKINVDPHWTAEAIANILDNAVKYSPRGSGIRIRMQRLYSFVRIEIEDSGCGIPQNERNSIFKRFYRGASDTVKNAEGTGIGLYLTRRITEDQGGTVTVRTASGGGSIFTVQLPL